jgi:hypothetical protein
VLRFSVQGRHVTDQTRGGGVSILEGRHGCVHTHERLSDHPVWRCTAKEASQKVGLLVVSDPPGAMRVS